MSKSFARSFLGVLFFAVALGACDDDPTGLEGVADIAGTYTLQTVDGDSLPTIVDSDDGIDEVWTRMVITLKTDGTLTGELDWQEVTTGTDTVVDSDTDHFSGTFELDGTDILLDIQDMTDLQGTVSDDTFSFTVEGHLLVLTK